jgi:hypothetical protein
MFPLEGRSGLVGLPFLLWSAERTSTTLEWTENNSELKLVNYIFKLHKFNPYLWLRADWLLDWREDGVMVE